MQIRTTRFGELTIEPHKIIEFKHGLPGFEDERAFVILWHDRESPFLFLQSAKTPELAFMLTNPFLYFPDYTFEIDDDTLAELDIQSEEDVEVLVVVTIPGGRVEDMTVNLFAPVVVSLRSLAARQIVLEGSSYQIRRRLAGLPAGSAKEGA